MSCKKVPYPVQISFIVAASMSKVGGDFGALTARGEGCQATDHCSRQHFKICQHKPLYVINVRTIQRQHNRMFLKRRQELAADLVPTEPG